jgi:uncharacterized membrane protein
MTTRWGTSRIEAFSDGVFAIAITLLVLDIRLPAGADEDLYDALLQAWPSYLGYATSFCLIGGIWLAHHGLFSRLRQVSQTLLRVNLLLLMAVSFVPFPTRLVAETIDHPNAEQTAVIFYGATLLVVSVILATMWRIVERDRDLLRPEITESELKRILRRSEPNLGFYVTLTALAYFFPRAAAFGFLASALLILLRVQGEHDRHPRADRPGRSGPWGGSGPDPAAE